MCPTPLNRLPKLFSLVPADEDDELVLMFPRVFPKVGNYDIRFQTKTKILLSMNFRSNLDLPVHQLIN